MFNDGCTIRCVLDRQGADRVESRATLAVVFGLQERCCFDVKLLARSRSRSGGSRRRAAVVTNPFVARCNNFSPGLLFAWRRQLRGSAAKEPLFVQALATADQTSPALLGP